MLEKEVCSPVSRPGSKVGSGQPMSPERAAIHHVVALTRYPSSIHMRVSVAMLRSLQR